VPPALTLLDDVRWQGRPVPGERSHALLAALVLSAGRPVSQAGLVDQVWGPDDVPANPTKALQVLVSRTRAQTGADAVLRTDHGYRLGVPDADVDALDLRDHVVVARAAETAGDLARARDEAAAVVGTTVGADGDDGPLEEVRREARAHVEEAGMILGRALSGLGRHAEALALLEPALARDPDDEALLAAVLRSEAAERGAPAALDRYERYREQVRDRLGTDPGPGLQALHAELLAKDSPVRDGLLYDATSLIGRDHDVAALAETIRTSRVTSIVGPGGLGKTRLAHVMGRLAEQPVVHFVELAGVDAPEGVAAEIGSALGVRDSVANRRLLASAAQRSDLAVRIVEQIGSTPTLLILDNCEHVVAAVADVVAMMVARTPALRVLTTTRAPLGLAAERVYSLPQLAREDGVRLFRERATAARRGVRLEQERVEALVDRLDGLPLAIELAAARVRAMSVDEIARRLDDRFSLLRGGSREAPERHQTLLAVIDWSWNLLDPDEQFALRRVAAFRDGFSLEGAAAVIGTDVDPVDVVTRLVDQSLVVVQETDGELRYRLLETVREFGRIELARAGDEKEAERLLQAWAVGFAVDANERLFTVEQVATMRRIRAEEGNLHDVLTRDLAAGDAAAVIPVMAALSSMWTVEGNHLKVVTVASSVEDVIADADVPAELEDPLRSVLAMLTLNTMIFTATPAERAVRRLRELGPDSPDPRVRALTRVLLAVSELGLEGFGRPGALDDLCADPEPQTARLALQFSTGALENSGLMPEAFAAARRSLALCDDADGPWARALAQAQLAGLAVQVGDLPAARAYAEASLPTMEALQATEDLTQLRALLVVVALDDGRLDDAERLMATIVGDERNQSVFGGGVVVHCGGAELALARGDIEDGLARYRAAVVVLRDRVIRGADLPVEFAPWVIYPEAATIAAHVRYDRAADVADMLGELQEKVGLLLAGESGFLDYPVAGTVIYSLALWELARADLADVGVERAIRLLVLADVFGYNRTLPSLDWEFPAGLAEERRPGLLATIREEYAGRNGPELREEAQRLVAELQH
jgi:predicted ATPase/DNA-binding SARP family transcriptional activator